MRKVALIVIILFGLNTQAQISVGITTLLPKNGTYTAPVAPLSFRNIGFTISKVVYFGTGYSLFHFSSAGLIGLPFDAGKSALARNFSHFVPLEMGIAIPLGDVKIMPRAGVFGVYSFGNKIDHGVFDLAYAKYLGYSLLNGSSSINNKVGWGWHYGLKVDIKITNKFSLVLGGNYLKGKSPMSISGNYSAYQSGSSGVISKGFSFENAGMDYSGIEFSVGVGIKNK